MDYSEVSAKTNENVSTTIENFARTIVAEFESKGAKSSGQTASLSIGKGNVEERQNETLFKTSCTC